MRRPLACFAVVSALAAAQPAWAETITIACEGKEMGKPYSLNLVYESGDPSTLKVSGAYGEFTLPAGKSINEGDGPDGVKISVTNIWGSADLNLKMPDQAALEACVRKRLTPEQMTDKDIVFSTIFPCAAETPAASEPVPAKVSATVSILEGSALVIVKRTYVKKSDLPESEISLEPLPPPDCNVK
jgi:hypothetical protein